MILKESFESFSLPGGLLFNESFSGCSRFESIAIHPLTGREEDWLANSREVPPALLASRLIDACVVSVDGEQPPPRLARRLLSGDRDYLILQIRRLSLGDDIRAVVTCPECDKDMDVNFNADEIGVDGQPQYRYSYTLELEARDDLPSTSVEFRLPIGADQEAIARLSPAEAATGLFSRCLLNDGGYALTELEIDRVISMMGSVAPAINLELDLVCPDCGHKFVFPFDTSSYFFEEMRAGGRQLLHEVHSLAFYYHWTESEILSLVRERRRSYLALLRETLAEV